VATGAENAIQHKLRKSIGIHIRNSIRRKTVMFQPPVGAAAEGGGSSGVTSPRSELGSEVEKQADQSAGSEKSFNTKLKKKKKKEQSHKKHQQIHSPLKR
jgi:hypothetical protein